MDGKEVHGQGMHGQGMHGDELRRVWNRFFGDRGHTVVPSAGLIPHHPTAPMFTNSGMMQFVPYFLGEEAVPYTPPRAVTVQKCVRVGGKHNDLDAIGSSLRHLSFFEMLGNFSFGDYAKADTIRWAWELVTDVLGIDGDRLWVTVHVSDDEAEAIWRDEVGFPGERIQRLDEANFWEMGEVGPCGPSSELFFDHGAELGPDGGPANPAAEDRFVEFWNLVFPRYRRGPGGELSDLPRKNIDTGAGFERMLGVVNGTRNPYDLDVLAPLVDAAQSITGRTLGRAEQDDVALRLLADHTRTMTFLVADGVVPTNEERGYVVRRVIRRTVRYGYLLGVESTMTPTLVERCIDVMGAAYPELVAGRDTIVSVIEREEARFRSTLRRGVERLDEALAAEPERVSGAVAFQLHDTFGFPLEVTQEIAAERGVGVDVGGFEELMAGQRARAKAAGRRDPTAAGLESCPAVLDRYGPTDFVGREEFETKATILAVVDDGVFLDRSPFYAEAGGQVGDTGTLSTDTGRADVVDTVLALPGLHRHVVRVVEGTLTPGQEATAVIDVARRDAIRRNHTGTHILHFALRRVLGPHVRQQGSYVGPDRLRFDFGPAEALTPAQVREIEDLANQEILANEAVRHYETTKEHAEELGAIAFFGDKYGEIVRVLEAGRHSVELCGGTHVRALGDIGPVKIVSEASIGADLRRLEAVTGTGPIDRLRRDEELLGEVAGLLNVGLEEVGDGVRRRLEEVRALRDELKSLRRRAATGRSSELAGTAVDGVVVARVDGVSRDDLRDLALAVRDRAGVDAVVLGTAVEGGGAALVSAVTGDSGLHAAELIAEASRTIKGGGGKAPDVAVAGGKDAGSLDAALDQARVAAARR